MAKRPRGFFSDEWLNGQFASAKIANRVLAETLIPKLEVQSDQIIDDLIGPLNELVNGFYIDLVQYLGKEQSLKDQVPTVPDLRQWNSLSEKYIRRKGNKFFFYYTLSNKIAKRRSIGLSRLRGTDYRIQKITNNRLRNRTLISVLRNTSVERTLGGITISRKSILEDRIVERNIFRYSRSQRKSLEQYRSKVRGSRNLFNIPAYNVKIEFRLWSNVTRAELAQIERKIFQGSDTQTYIKLINPRGYRRPLLRPWMAYYSRVKIPNLIRDILIDYKPQGSQINISGGPRLGAL